MFLKVTVRTPKGRAEKASKYQADQILGMKNADKIIETKLVNDSKFYWIVQADNDKEIQRITYGAARSEVTIRKFYQTLFKHLARANRLASKFKKGASWARKWLMKQFKKQVQGDESKLQSFKDYLDNTPDSELLKVTDKKDMTRLLAKALIKVEEYKQ